MTCSALPWRHLILAALLLAGCAGDRNATGTVRGRVTFQGKPVSGAVVLFQPADGGPAVFAHLEDDGTFQVRTHDRKGLPAGAYRVAVKPAPRFDGTPPLAGAGKDAPGPRPSPLVLPKFHSVETSGLTVRVEPGANKPYEFDVGRSP